MLGLLLIPEETEQPMVLKSLEPSPASNIRPCLIPRGRGFVKAVINPVVNAIHLGSCGAKKEKSHRPSRSRPVFLKKQCLKDACFEPKRERIILYDPLLLKELHRRVWKRLMTGS